MATGVPITYMNSSAALKAFVGCQRRSGVHLVERPRHHGSASAAPWAVRPHGGRHQGPLLPRSASRSQHRVSSWASARPTWRFGTPARQFGGLEERRVKESALPVVERPLLGPPALPSRTCRRVQGRPSGRQGNRAPGVQPRGGGPRRRRRLHRPHHPGGGRPPQPGRPSASAPRSTSFDRLDDEHPDITRDVRSIRSSARARPCSGSTPRICAWVLEELVEGGWRTGSP